jgi:hypothetical protein
VIGETEGKAGMFRHAARAYVINHSSVHTVYRCTLRLVQLLTKELKWTCPIFLLPVRVEGRVPKL